FSSVISPTSLSLSFSFHTPATTEIYTLSLHDALPISCASPWRKSRRRAYGSCLPCFIMENRISRGLFPASLWKENRQNSKIPVNRKGSLGCPYAIADYRGVNPEYGTREDLEHLAEEIHKRGMK